MSILIAVNVQSFMQNLLMSLKRLLSEASIIKTSYNTNILVFAFVRFSYLNTSCIVDGYVLLTNYLAVKYEFTLRKESTVLEYA